MEKRHSLNVIISDDVLDDVEKIAEIDGTNRSIVARQAIKEYIKNRLDK